MTAASINRLRRSVRARPATNTTSFVAVSATRYFSVYDKFENMGAQMVREVASTNALAGDGTTTTATVLAQAIVKEGAKSVAAGGLLQRYR